MVKAKVEQVAVIQKMIADVEQGRSIVPLVGAGISIEAGIPSLLEVSRYLAKTKLYLRYRIYEDLSSSEQIAWGGKRVQRLELPPFRRPATRYLQEFGWPDPHQLNSDLWHWLSRARKPFMPWSLDRIVEAENLETLSHLDRSLTGGIERLERRVGPGSDRPLWAQSGSYWKLLLPQLTRSSPDLVDTLFRRLTEKREPGAAHRYFAFLTPVLRLRLFLTINFDNLLEEALRLEGFRPTVYDVAEGRPLPSPQLVQKDLSVVKLHGGAYGLLVGDKLDTPLDEDTRQRLRQYFPDQPILLVMGIGGWDQRVLDLVELVHEKDGRVVWLRFEADVPKPVEDRFGVKRKGRRVIPEWFETCQVRKPAAFLRELYSRFTGSHPSSKQPFRAYDHRPVLVREETRQDLHSEKLTFFNERVVAFFDRRDDYGIGSSIDLSELVAGEGKTHLPIWIDVDTKATVEDIVVDMVSQLRRYDPGLPPEILAIERSTFEPHADEEEGDYRKVIRRLYAAFARGRYIVALNGVTSFGRRPTSHHGPDDLGRRKRKFAQLCRFLLGGIEEVSAAGGARWESELRGAVGLQDSIVALAVDGRGEAHELVESFRDRLETIAEARGSSNPKARGDDRKLAPILVRDRCPGLDGDPATLLLVSFRRRRSEVALKRLLGKYLALEDDPQGKWTTEECNLACEQRIEELEKSGFLNRVEGRFYWMPRHLRNEIYAAASRRTLNGDAAGRMRVQVTLAFIHKDLADYYHRDLYVGSQEITAFLEELYHRIASLRYFRRLEETLEETEGSIAEKDRDYFQRLGEHVRDETREPGKKRETASVVGGRDVPHDLKRIQRLAFRSLRKVLEEEREALLTRLPSWTLQQWIQQVRDHDLERMLPAGGEDDVLKEAERLVECLDDLAVEVLRDRIAVDDLVRLRVGWLRVKVEISEQGSGHERRNEKWWRIRERWLDDDEAPEKLLGWLLGSGGGGEHGPRLEALLSLSKTSARTRKRVAGALVDLAFALRHRKRYKERSAAVEKLLADLSRRWKEGHGDWYLPADLLELEVEERRIAAGRALWRVSPWDTKGKSISALKRQRKLARKALRYSEEALRDLDAVKEKDRTLRSYFYSVRGGAFYLCNDVKKAYREFDLARAGLSEATSREREALATALLHQSECLMVHADDGLARWVLDRVGLPSDEERASLDESPSWLRRLSSEGWRKIHRHGKIGDREIEELLELSLANWSPDHLHRVDATARRDEELRGELTSQLSAAEYRLMAASDLLDRVERLLEPSRRNVERWAFLFQLRAQLSVERLLFLVTGGLALSYEDARKGEWKAEMKRTFIGRFRSILREGLQAIRRGFDILLPSDRERKDRKAQLEGDLLIQRFLRLWTELMVCGAILSEMPRTEEPLAVLDDNVRQLAVHDRDLKKENEKEQRWEQWRDLNRLAGFVLLPECREVREWFLHQDWPVMQPGLAARARALARMDLCLASSRGTVPLMNGQMIEIRGGEAIAHLMRHLLGGGSERIGESPSSGPGLGLLTGVAHWREP